MKVIREIKIGGLQQKIFNLMLIFIVALISAYIAVSVYQQQNLTNIVQQASEEQQTSIAAVSEETMNAVLDTSMSRTTALQAYIADDLFAHADSFPDHPYAPPILANDGIPSVQMQHEERVDPTDSQTLGLLANMSEVMLAMFENSGKLSSCFVATTDGCILFTDDRAGSYFSETGER